MNTVMTCPANARFCKNKFLVNVLCNVNHHLQLAESKCASFESKISYIAI
jgi:hypothetical protein